jgi:hypothetical protein
MFMSGWVYVIGGLVCFLVIEFPVHSVALGSFLTHPSSLPIQGAALSGIHSASSDLSTTVGTISAAD